MQTIKKEVIKEQFSVLTFEEAGLLFNNKLKSPL